MQSTRDKLYTPSSSRPPCVGPNPLFPPPVINHTTPIKPSLIHLSLSRKTQSSLKKHPRDMSHATTNPPTSHLRSANQHPLLLCNLQKQPFSVSEPFLWRSVRPRDYVCQGITKWNPLPCNHTSGAFLSFLFFFNTPAWLCNHIAYRLNSAKYVSVCTQPHFLLKGQVGRLVWCHRRVSDQKGAGRSEQANGSSRRSMSATEQEGRQIDTKGRSSASREQHSTNHETERTVEGETGQNHRSGRTTSIKRLVCVSHLKMPPMVS